MVKPMVAVDEDDEQWQHLEIDVRGTIQRVNFRMAMRQLATSLNVAGTVENDKQDTDLVHIVAEGRKHDLDDMIFFIKRMVMERPKIITDDKGRQKVIGPRYQIHVKEIQEKERRNLEEEDAEQRSFRIIRERIDDPVQAEILEKLSLGGIVYQQFHHDHNENFEHLDGKYEAITNTIQQIGKDIQGGLSPMAEYFRRKNERQWFRKRKKPISMNSILDTLNEPVLHRYHLQ